MNLKKLERIYVKPVGKMNWAIIGVGFFTSLVILLVSYQLGGTQKEIAILTSLFIFAIGYNQVVTWLEHQGYDEGFTSFLVIGGTLYTLYLLSCLIGHFTTMLKSFAAAGIPMVIGSCIRYVMRRRRETKQALAKALKDLGG